MSTPFDNDCTDDAVKTLTLSVNASQTLAVDRPQITTTYHIGTFPPANDTVQVSATGAAVSITVQSFTDSGGPWLNVTAQRAITPAALNISYSVSGLAPGTYTGRITVTAGGEPALTIPVTLVVVLDSNIQFQAFRHRWRFPRSLEQRIRRDNRSGSRSPAPTDSFRRRSPPPRRTANGLSSRRPQPPRRRRSPWRSVPRIWA